jgi:hypothetical protein
MAEMEAGAMRDSRGSRDDDRDRWVCAWRAS